MTHKQRSTTIQDHLHSEADALLRESEAAALLGFTQRALQAWRQRGQGPPFVRISSRAVRYRRKDLTRWAEGLIRNSTSDPGTRDSGA
jgi:predicted DNA-binding transcriptional regulator AlpA